MPLFEYQCRECGHRFEAFVTSARQPECPECHGKDLEKQVSVFGVGAGSSYPSSSKGSCSTGGG